MTADDVTASQTPVSRTIPAVGRNLDNLTMSKPVKRDSIRHELSIYGPALVAVVIAFVVAYQFIKPAPPSRVVMASGGEQGAYHAYAQRYAEYLAKEGIALEIRTSAGSVENLDLLDAGEVSVALVQGGVEETAAKGGKVSLGSVFYEPLWLFHRSPEPITRLAQLQGLTVAMGPQGSGTRALMKQLLAANQIPVDPDWPELSSAESVEALLAGEVDAIVLVSSASSPLLRRLMRAEGIALASLERAPAYARRFGYLTAVKLPEGVIDLADNIPAREITLLAPAANLVASEDLHPAVIDLLLQAANEVHGQPGLFENNDQFPMEGLLAYPLSKEAARYYKYGPPFLQRFMPFWAASLVDRLKVMLLPLVVLMFPLFKIMPPIYHWRMRARIYRWYGELEEIEARHQQGEGSLKLLAELAQMDREVSQVNVPLSFTDQLYHLRLHIGLVRGRVQNTD